MSSAAYNLISTHSRALGMIAINSGAGNRPCFASITLCYYQLCFTITSVTALSGNGVAGKQTLL